jgi:hypothetical protein
MTPNKLTPDVDYGFAIYMISDSFHTVSSLHDIDGIEKVVLEIEKQEYYPAYIQVNEMLEPKDRKYGERKTVDVSEYKTIKLYSKRSEVPGMRNEMKSFFLLDDIEEIPVWDEKSLSEKSTLLIDDGLLYLEVPEMLYDENKEKWDKLAYNIKKVIEPKKVLEK